MISAQTIAAPTCDQKEVNVKASVRSISLVLLTLMFGLILAAPAGAHAQDCTTYMQNIINNFSNIPPGGQATMQVAMVSNRSDGRYVSYGEKPSMSGTNGSSGPLVYYPGGWTWFGYYPATLQGTLSQFFSDRRFNQNGSFNDPFDPANTDNLGITIFLEYSYVEGVNPGEVVLTLNSWGGGQLSFQGQCQNGMINGFDGVNTEFVLSLFNQYVPPPIN
jgi:hypothetical protein